MRKWNDLGRVSALETNRELRQIRSRSAICHLTTNQHYVLRLKELIPARGWRTDALVFCERKPPYEVVSDVLRQRSQHSLEIRRGPRTCRTGLSVSIAFLPIHPGARRHPTFL